MKKQQLTMTELPDLAADSVGQQAEQAALESHLEALQDQLREMNTQLAQSNRELQRLSSLDGLTGIANRRHFDEVLERLPERPRIATSPASRPTRCSASWRACMSSSA